MTEREKMEQTPLPYSIYRRIGALEELAVANSDAYKEIQSSLKQLLVAPLLTHEDHQGLLNMLRDHQEQTKNMRTYVRGAMGAAVAALGTVLWAHAEKILAFLRGA